MPFVAVIAVLGRRLDVALTLTAKLPRLALDGFFSLLRCHVFFSLSLAAVTQSEQINFLNVPIQVRFPPFVILSFWQRRHSCFRWFIHWLFSRSGLVAARFCRNTENLLMCSSPLVWIRWHGQSFPPAPNRN